MARSRSAAAKTPLAVESPDSVANAAIPSVRAGKRTLPEHIARLQAPFQVWDYIWWLQDRLEKAEELARHQAEEIDAYDKLSRGLTP